MTLQQKIKITIKQLGLEFSNGNATVEGRFSVNEILLVENFQVYSCFAQRTMENATRFHESIHSSNSYYSNNFDVCKSHP